MELETYIDLILKGQADIKKKNQKVHIQIDKELADTEITFLQGALTRLKDLFQTDVDDNDAKKQEKENHISKIDTTLAKF